MKFYLKLLVLPLFTLLFAVGCDDGDKPKVVKATGMDISKATNFMVATDAEGHINIYMIDDLKNVVRLDDRSFQFNKPGATTPLSGYGEIHFSHLHKLALILVRTGADDKGNGGILVFNPSQVIKEQKTAAKLYPLVTTTKRYLNTAAAADKTGDLETSVSVPVHAFVDADGHYIWINNDGYSHPATPTITSPVSDPNNDSVFRVSLAYLETDAASISSTLPATAVTEIELRHGHKKSALMSPLASTPPIPRPYLFASHNGNGTISVVNQANGTPALIQTVDTAIIVPVTETTSYRTSAGFHGAASSRVNGHLYFGSTNKPYPVSLDAIPAIPVKKVSAVNGTAAIVIVDASSTPTAAGSYAISAILRGTGTLQIPSSGYLKASHDEKRIYSFGRANSAWEMKTDMTLDYSKPTAALGYFAVIDSSNADNVVKAVLPLGNINAASFDIASVTHMEGLEMHKMQYVFIPGANAACFDRTTVNPLNLSNVAKSNQIAVVELNEAGDLVADSLLYINVGMGTCHRNGEVSEDNQWVIYPNGCPNSGPEKVDACTVKSVNLIETMPETHGGIKEFHVKTFDTKGVSPGAVVFVPKELVGLTTKPHTH